MSRERWEEIDESRASFEGRISVRETDELICTLRSMRDRIAQLEAERAELVEAVELLLDKRRWGRWDYMDDPELYQRADEVRRLIAKHKEQA